MSCAAQLGSLLSCHGVVDEIVLADQVAIGGAL
jgi:hypothetical protein